jgi:hypothetical protein
LLFLAQNLNPRDKNIRNLNEVYTLKPYASKSGIRVLLASFYVRRTILSA